MMYGVYLGWHRLLETDTSGLSAVQRLCQSLEIRTHWDPESGVLHLESPAENKTVALLGEDTAVSLVEQVRATLTSAGARVTHDPAAAELVVVLRCGQPGHKLRVSHALSRGSRHLARVLLGTLVAASGGPGSLRLDWRTLPTHCPAVQVDLPNLRRWQPSLARTLAEGLMRYWAPADLAGLLAHQPAHRLSPVPIRSIGGAEAPAPAAPADRTPVPAVPPVEAAPAKPPSGSESAVAAICRQESNPFKPPGGGRVHPFPTGSTKPQAVEPAVAAPEAPCPQPELPASIIPVSTEFAAPAPAESAILPEPPPPELPPPAPTGEPDGNLPEAAPPPGPVWLAPIGGGEARPVRPARPHWWRG